MPVAVGAAVFGSLVGGLFVAVPTTMGGLVFDEPLQEGRASNPRITSPISTRVWNLKIGMFFINSSLFNRQRHSVNHYIEENRITQLLLTFPSLQFDLEQMHIFSIPY